MPKIFPRTLSEIVRSETAKTSVWVIAGNVFLSGLGFLLLLVLTRKLGPERYGLFATAMAVSSLLIGLTDLGLGAAVVRFSNKYKDTRPEYVTTLLSSILRLEITLSGLILVGGVLLAGPIVDAVWHDPAYLVPVRWAFLVGAILSLAAYNSAVLQAFQKFLNLFITNLSGSATRLVLVLLLLATSQLNESSALASYAVASTILLVTGFYFVSSRVGQINLSLQWAPLLEVWQFSRWIIVSFIVNTIAGRLDIFLLSTLKGATEVGYYSAAFQLSSAFPVILGALNLVLLPKVSAFIDPVRYRQYFSKAVISSLILGSAFLIVLPFSNLLIQTIFGTKYVSSIEPFQILYVGFLLALLATAVSPIIYAKEKTFFPAIVNVIQLGVVLTLNLLLIPTLGGTGAAFAFLGSSLIGTVAIVFYAARLVYKHG